MKQSKDNKHCSTTDNAEFSTLKLAFANFSVAT